IPFHRILEIRDINGRIIYRKRVNVSMRG
ncbi:MAG TPA: DUF504 domain-containing protein, partial [Thermoprotei archaeon]|nr:DUF504 domain-containing protein [Thermoprotei archaeon]